MTGLDTNVLIRFFVQDDPKQSRSADEFLQSLTPADPGFISLVVLAETVWVLRSHYGVTKVELIHRLNQLLNSPELILEGETAVVQAAQLFANRNADFVDCLVERTGHLAGCGATVTFDRAAARFAGMQLLSF